MDLPEVASAARLSLRPGDRLVLSVAQRLSDYEFESLNEQVKTWGLPDGVKIIILEQGMSLEVLAREES